MSIPPEYLRALPSDAKSEIFADAAGRFTNDEYTVAAVNSGSKTSWNISQKSRDGGLNLDQITGITSAIESAGQKLDAQKIQDWVPFPAPGANWGFRATFECK